MAGRSVARGRHSQFAQGGVCLLFLFLLSQPLKVSAQATQDSYQKRFNFGVTALFSGNYTEAEEIFEALYSDTKAPRVKLEWARSAFLARKYDLARRLFEEVLQGDIPDTVRFNVSLFLTEIAKLSSYTDYGFNFVRDTNPFVISSAQKIIVFGIPFDYTSPISQQTLNGIRFYLSNSSVLSSSGNLRTITEIDTTKYEGKNNERSALKLGLQYSPYLRNLSYKLGVDYYQQRSELLLRQPHVSANYRVNQITGFLNSWEIEGRFGKNEYPDYPDVSGRIRSINFAGKKNVNPTLQGVAGLYHDHSEANRESQGYKTLSINVGLKYFSDTLGSALQVSHVTTERKYKAIDELFLVKRADKREFFGLLIQPYKFRFNELYPSLEIGTEKNRSNVSISSFRRAVVNMGLRKNF